MTRKAIEGGMSHVRSYTLDVEMAENLDQMLNF